MFSKPLTPAKITAIKDQFRRLDGTGLPLMEIYDVIAMTHGVSVASVMRYVKEKQEKRANAFAEVRNSARAEYLEVDFSNVVEVIDELTTKLEPPQTKSARVAEDKTRLEIFLSDTHCPYEDKPTVEIALQVIRNSQPEIIYLGGDILDGYPVSTHDKDANRATPAALKAELEYTFHRLQEIRDAAPNAEIYYREGNHETRLSRYIAKNASCLKDLDALTLQSLLKLDELNITWSPQTAKHQIGKLWHIHGNEMPGAGQNPAQQKFPKMLCNFIFGDSHRFSRHIATNYEEEAMGGFGNACACSLNVEYIHHAYNWNLGFSLIEYTATGAFQVEQVFVNKPSFDSMQASAIVRGEKYSVDLGG